MFLIVYLNQYYPNSSHYILDILHTKDKKEKFPIAQFHHKMLCVAIINGWMAINNNAYITGLPLHDD